MSQWASQLSADPSNFNINGYIETDGFRRLLSQGVNRNGGLLALLGSQGVGKSDALLHLFYTAGVTIKRNVLFLNWRDPSEQIRDLLRHDYGLPTVDTNSPFTRMKEDFNSTYRLLLRTEIRKTRYVPIKLPKGRTLTDDLTSLDVDWAEKQLGQANCASLREQAWFRVIRSAKIVLIDLPDYARTDKRLMNRHLDEIYRLWNRLHSYPNPPSIIIAIQKEMIHGHSFFGKMEKIEIRPLTAEEMLQSYTYTFKCTYPFDEAALLELARLSRGIYRRFKRYITLTIDAWHLVRKELITSDLVREVVTAERLAEDLDFELEELFPKNIDARRDAARIIHHLRSAGPLDQTSLGEALEMPAYTLSRLLSKMESHFVTRKNDGSRKTVSVVDIR